MSDTLTQFGTSFQAKIVASLMSDVKFLGTIMFICFAVYMPGPVLEEYNGGWIPIWPVIGCFFAVYGGLIGIIYQPYQIYKRLK